MAVGIVKVADPCSKQDPECARHFFKEANAKGVGQTHPKPPTDPSTSTCRSLTFFKHFVPPTQDRN